MADPDISDIKRRMDGALTALKTEFMGLRTGRASASLLDRVMVDAYGAQMPLAQVGNVNVPEPRMITLNVWDRGLVVSVQKAIREAGLGLNPAADGQLVRVPIPELSQERRAELGKIVHKYAEQARVSVRNVRRDGMEMLKKMEKDGQLSQDAHRGWSDKVQELTDSHIADIDKALSAKEKEILQI